MSSSGYTNGATSTCTEINPNSSCVFSFDNQQSLILGNIQSIQLVNVKYYFKSKIFLRIFKLSLNRIFIYFIIVFSIKYHKIIHNLS